MVRLEVYVTKEEAISSNNFNSFMVRLEVYEFMPEDIAYCNFNSFMVRLEVVTQELAVTEN